MYTCLCCFAGCPWADFTLSYGRSVEVLKVSTCNCCSRCPPVTPLMLGAIITSQAVSIQKLTLNLRSSDFTGSDSAILVSSDALISRLMLMQ